MFKELRRRVAGGVTERSGEKGESEEKRKRERVREVELSRSSFPRVTISLYPNHRQLYNKVSII